MTVCPALPTPSFGTKLRCPWNKVFYNTVCEFSCKIGYAGSGPKARRCQNNGTWSGREFSCEVINCTSLTINPRDPLRTNDCGNHSPPPPPVSLQSPKPPSPIRAVKLDFQDQEVHKLEKCNFLKNVTLVPLVIVWMARQFSLVLPLITNIVECVEQRFSLLRKFNNLTTLHSYGFTTPAALSDGGHLCDYCRMKHCLD